MSAPDRRREALNTLRDTQDRLYGPGPFRRFLTRCFFSFSVGFVGAILWCKFLR